MNDRRQNWKAELSREAQERAAKRMALLDELETIRDEMKSCGVDFERRDQVSLKYRETAARLATL